MDGPPVVLEHPPGQSDNAGLNAKLGYDAIAGLIFQMLADNQAAARALQNLGLSIATDAHIITNRKAHNSEDFDKLVNMMVAPAVQTGTTEQEQTVSPAGTAESEGIKGGVGVSAEQVAANIPTLTGPVLAGILSALAQLAQAITPVILTAAGGASTPSQTKPAT